MPQPRQISPTSAPRETRQTLGALLMKRTESDELRSKILSRRPEVLDIRSEFSSSEPTREGTPQDLQALRKPEQSLQLRVRVEVKLEGLQKKVQQRPTKTTIKTWITPSPDPRLLVVQTCRKRSITDQQARSTRKSRPVAPAYR